MQRSSSCSCKVPTQTPSRLQRILARRCDACLRKRAECDIRPICTGERGVPTDELEIAADIYIGLQGFFGKHKDLREHPLFITGESYGGKYVPAIGMIKSQTCMPFCSLHTHI